MKYRTLISEEQIDARFAEMGAEISADYADKDLLLVAVLKGAFMSLADLSRHIAGNMSGQEQVAAVPTES